MNRTMLTSGKKSRDAMTIMRIWSVLALSSLHKHNGLASWCLSIWASSSRPGASIAIGQRLVARYQKQAVQEKPPTPLLAKTGDQSSALPPERGSKDPGVVVCQEVKSAEGASIPSTRHADANEHGTAQDGSLRM